MVADKLCFYVHWQNRSPHFDGSLLSMVMVPNAQNFSWQFPFAMVCAHIDLKSNYMQRKRHYTIAEKIPFCLCTAILYWGHAI